MDQTFVPKFYSEKNYKMIIKKVIQCNESDCNEKYNQRRDIQVKVLPCSNIKICANYLQALRVADKLCTNYACKAVIDENILDTGG
jgi:hypothetical protein